MKLGIVSTMRASPWGGSEELWAETALAALKVGITVSVCLQRELPKHPKVEKLIQDGARVVGDPPKGAITRDLAIRATALSYRFGNYIHSRLSPLWRFLAQDHDVILVSEGGAVPSVENIDLLRQACPSTPYVVVSHNVPPFSFSTSHRQKAAAFFDRAFAALFVSEASREQTQKVLCHQIRRSEIIRNPVNLQDTTPVDWPRVDTTTMALVGALAVHQKGQDLLFEALRSKAWQNRQWRLSIYGSGPDEDYLRDLCRFYELSEKVTFRGHEPNVRSIWREHQILIHPSRVDSAPLSIVEAMLCARPAVATAVGGIAEWICNGKDGFVANAATLAAVSEALERAWRERDSWYNLGVNARRSALARYDPNPGDTMLSILIDAAGAHVRNAPGPQSHVSPTSRPCTENG